MIEQAGFVDAELIGETGFNSSSVTKGVLLRATKSLPSNSWEKNSKNRIRPIVK
jgi:hypothetical protein